VVEQADVEQGQGILQAPRDGLVRQAGLIHSGRVIVCGDQGRSAVTQCLFRHYAWVHRCAVYGAVEQFFEGNDPVTRIQEKAGEHLVRMITQDRLQASPRTNTWCR
jgi:hypothetical protein